MMKRLVVVVVVAMITILIMVVNNSLNCSCMLKLWELTAEIEKLKHFCSILYLE
jgi:hypothetical protein